MEAVGPVAAMLELPAPAPPSLFLREPEGEGQSFLSSIILLGEKDLTDPSIFFLYFRETKVMP